MTFTTGKTIDTLTRKVLSLRGVAHDITNRKPGGEGLPENEDSLRLIIDTIPVMAWTLRPDGAVDFINKRWRSYAGISLEEGIGQPTRVIHPEDLPRVVEKVSVRIPCESRDRRRFPIFITFPVASIL